MVPEGFQPWQAPQPEHPGSPQLPAGHGRVEDGPYGRPCGGLLALDQEAGRQAAQPVAGGADVDGWA